MGTKAEKDRQKQIQDRCQNLLTQMLRDDDNKYCVDCDAKGPRWASWNLGIFLCIRCAGIHRNLGVHISKVKSVNLDSWTPEQVVSLQQMGNSRARAVYEANIPDSFRRPQTDMALEAFIRAKYDAKKYIAKEWVPPQLPKVNWDKELDEEEKARKKKREAKAGTTPMASLPARKLESVIPAPLPKPSTSPKSQRGAKGGAPPVAPASNSADLLGLDTPVSDSGAAGGGGGLSDDVFTSFLAAAPAPAGSGAPSAPATGAKTRSGEEEEFFNQPLTAPAGAPGGDKKLTTDSILALYAQSPQQNTLGFSQPTPMAAGVGVGQPFMAQPGVGMFQGYQVPNGTATAAQAGGIPQHGMHAGMFPPQPTLGGLGSNPFFAPGGPLAQAQANNRMGSQGASSLPPTAGLTNNLWH